ncbi:MAG TPA: dihydropteroate synthase [Chloroflexota bacterium]|nr:dihydropteroate synthase [Chloroflexota bacterium]
MSQPFPWRERTCVMGILNVTPDSFSGDGLLGNVEAASERANAMAAAGADLIDVGGESTAYWKAGYQPVTEEEELRRVLPIVKRLRDIPISIDTRKPGVARAALSAGAAWLNNVEGVWDDGRMAEVAAEHGVPYILMHNRHEAVYGDVVAEVRDELVAAAARAEAAGVRREHVILDPGLGFGKTGAHNLELLRRLPELVSAGYPVLVGPSRKRFLGLILGTPEQDRVEGTAAAVAIAIAGGAAAVRVHDVPQMVRVVRVADAIVRSLPIG